MEQSPLAAWESFYVIVGSSGAALTGLQFIVIALIAESRKQSTHREIQAFGTPTIVHFCAVLLVAAILSAPWQTLTSIALALAACGLAGTIYSLIVLQRARRQTGYRPVFEDWLWFSILPLIAYSVLLVSAAAFRASPQRVLFVVGGMVLLLLFVGIHNSWDSVTYITVEYMQTNTEKDEK